MSFFAESSLHLYGTFFMFGAVLLLLFPICYIILPETKDISLGKNILRNLFGKWWFCVTEHIEQHFRRKSLTENCQLKGWQRLLVPEAKVPENDFHLKWREKFWSMTVHKSLHQWPFVSRKFQQLFGIQRFNTFFNEPISRSWMLKWTGLLCLFKNPKMYCHNCLM